MAEYIEREAAIEAVREKLRICEALPNDITKADAILTLKSIQESLESIPADDMRPVVKGHWTNHRTLFTDGDWYCSACGKAITIYMGPDREDRYAYCPNCGAEMR